MMEKIKRCPFCGSFAVGFFREYRHMQVRCDVCKARGPVRYATDIAIKHWNEALFGNERGDNGEVS